MVGFEGEIPAHHLLRLDCRHPKVRPRRPPRLRPDRHRVHDRRDDVDDDACADRPLRLHCLRHVARRHQLRRLRSLRRRCRLQRARRLAYQPRRCVEHCVRLDDCRHRYRWLVLRHHDRHRVHDRDADVGAGHDRLRHRHHLHRDYLDRDCHPIARAPVRAQPLRRHPQRLLRRGQQHPVQLQRALLVQHRVPREQRRAQQLALLRLLGARVQLLAVHEQPLAEAGCLLHACACLLRGGAHLLHAYEHRPRDGAFRAQRPSGESVQKRLVRWQLELADRQIHQRVPWPLRQQAQAYDDGDDDGVRLHPPRHHHHRHHQK